MLLECPSHLVVFMESIFFSSSQCSILGKETMLLHKRRRHKLYPSTILTNMIRMMEKDFFKGLLRRALTSHAHYNLFFNAFVC